MAGTALSHHGGRCKIETMLSHFDLDNPILWDVSRIVHEADLADQVYDAPEGRGLDLDLRGLSFVMGENRLVEFAEPIFEGLHEYRRRFLLAGRDPAGCCARGTMASAGLVMLGAFCGPRGCGPSPMGSPPCFWAPPSTAWG